MESYYGVSMLVAGGTEPHIDKVASPDVDPAFHDPDYVNINGGGNRRGRPLRC